ncbi:hypothetical protein BZA05DRAFT_401211 [Tricharina praecox]|uniref:uncharacterized protein n=1 Tax=Tricharina praecox TaxID=43433 RepID=UPI0022208612|nr:uncharacterized protein BZA05DRAFT_401211 [Tricharina praecox]KAI5849700.1 hypothetical protein BZA05DRAFT_401211 [Tricharina praecox]
MWILMERPSGSFPSPARTARTHLCPVRTVTSDGFSAGTYLRKPPTAPLPPAIRPRVPVTHDECTFNSTDSRRVIDGEAGVDDDHIPFFNKGRGYGMMVSEHLTPDGDTFRECTQIRDFGKEGYWTCDDMIAQLKDLTILSFEQRYSDHQASFFFDNATNHAAYAEDVLRAERLNLGPRGTQPLLRSGCNLRTQQPQSMQESRWA